MKDPCCAIYKAGVPAALAAAQTDGEAGVDVAEPSGRNAELLQNRGTDGRRGSRQWKHQSTVTPWSELPRSRLPATEAQRLAATRTDFIAFQKAV
jgi:hypothetical protein